MVRGSNWWREDKKKERRRRIWWREEKKKKTKNLEERRKEEKKKEKRKRGEEEEGWGTCGTHGVNCACLTLIGLPSCHAYIKCTYRTKLQIKFDLLEDPAPDWFLHIFCAFCALCQEYRELQARGWDPSIGWNGN
ncbi:hypothetical protein Pint_15997 [Pistacia integerrima]|uniref:Uncharacterized protein n=1 Tax=Pistacia integerrima TaxID=434235 RepID=A0ACC0ZEN4_9ROSI|nr:hypothetical protein Pint_15997 [Pistacia integerrima]